MRYDVAFADGETATVYAASLVMALLLATDSPGRLDIAVASVAWTRLGDRQ